MTMLDRAPLPIRDKVINFPRWKDDDPKGPDPLAGLLTPPLIDYLTRQDAVLAQSPQRASVVELVDQGATINATDFRDGVSTAGLYLIQYYAAITRAATTSSSLEIMFDWVHEGVPKSHTFAAITGNTTSTTQADKSLLIRSDANAAIRYTATYASTGATSMLFSLDISLTLLKAA